MRHQIELLTTHQQRILSEACWQFEQALAEGKSVNPLDYVAQCSDIPPDILLTELAEIQKERLELQQDSVVTKPISVDGRYRLIDVIASGGSAVVWRAFDSHLQRETAVKFLLDSQDNPQMRKRLETEARLCARLVHPGIVPVYELSHFTDGRPFVSMKLVNGQTLHQLLDTSPPISMVAAIEIFSCVCQAMAYAHSQGIIHRDLKPRNIMVGAFGEIQVMDWGLGKEIDSPADSDRRVAGLLTSNESESQFKEERHVGQIPVVTDDSTLMGSVLGTLSYMSPEQACGDVRSTDRRSDVFALGAILCRILTGAPPYVAQDNESLIVKSQNGDLNDAHSRLHSARHNSLPDLSIRCMSVRPQDRPQDAQAVFEILIQIEKTKPRRKRLAIFSALVAVLTLFTSIAYIVSKISSRQLVDYGLSPSDTNLQSMPTLSSVITLLESNDFKAADEQFRDLVNLMPYNLGNRRAYCIALLNRERFKESEVLARELVQLDKREPEYPFLLSETLYFQGDFQESYAAMLESKQRRDQGFSTPLKIDDKLAYLKQTQSLFSRLDSLEQETLDDMPPAELRQLATICEIIKKVDLAIKFNNLSIEMEPDEAERTIHRFHLTNSFFRKHLSRKELSTSDRNLLYKEGSKWMSDQLHFVQQGPLHTKRTQDEVASMRMSLRKQLLELVESDFVQQASKTSDLEPEILKEFIQITATIQNMQTT